MMKTYCLVGKPEFMVLEYQTYFTAKYLREDTIGYLTNFAGLGTSNKYIWTQ